MNYPNENSRLDSSNSSEFLDNSANSNNKNLVFLLYSKNFLKKSGTMLNSVKSLHTNLKKHTIQPTINSDGSSHANMHYKQSYIYFLNELCG